MEEAFYEISSMRRFAGLSLAKGSVPDETTILNFRHLLENNGLSARIFAAVNSYLASRGLRLSKGTIVDATIIEAPSSTSGNSSDASLYGESICCQSFLVKPLMSYTPLPPMIPMTLSPMRFP